jgi:hypothetical protein
MRRRHARHTIVLSFALLTAACSVSRDELIGDFQINYGYGVETLRLMADGRYTQAFRLSDGNTWTTQSGAWELKDNANQEVDLQDAMRVDDGAGKLRDDYRKPVPGLWILPVKKGFNSLALVVDEKRNLLMHKLAPPPASDKKPNIIHLPPRNDVEVK